MKTLAPLQSKGIIGIVRLPMKTIPLTKGFEAIVDDKDYERVIAKKWHIKRSAGDKALYAYSYDPIAWKSKKYHRSIALHRFILCAEKNQIVDHRNGNGLDNRRENIRIATKSQNAMNMRKHSKTSQYKGVTRTKRNRTSPWIVKIKKDYKTYHIGCFKTELDAAIAYNRVAKELFGQFAFLNSI